MNEHLMQFVKIDREIANLIRTDLRPTKEIADQYGLSRQAVRNIQVGKAWFEVGDVLLDALKSKGNGSVPNGDNMRANVKHKPKVRLEDFHKPVVIKQPGAGKWSCDSCNTRGEGGEALLRHSSKSSHRAFTPLDGRYAHLIHSR